MIKGLGVPFWQEHVTAASAYKGSAIEYAKAHDISVSALYYWQRKFRAKETAVKKMTVNETYSKEPSFHSSSSKKVGAPSSLSSQFVALRMATTVAPLAPTTVAAHCTLVLASQVRLELSSLPDPQWLVNLVNATQGAQSCTRVA
jgi:transposase-like protein